MKYNVYEKLTEKDGTIAKDEKGIEATFEAVIGSYILAQMPPEQEDGEAKYKLYKSSIKMASTSNGIVDLTADEVAAIKSKVGRLAPPLVVGRVWDFLENPIVVDEKETEAEDKPKK